MSTVNEIGAALAKEFELQLHCGRWLQKTANCYDIASYLARQFGYSPPRYGEIKDWYYQYQQALYYKRTGFGERVANPPQLQPKAAAAIVLRENPDVGSSVHVAFELDGQEFNYGVCCKHGYNVLFRIPLEKGD